MMIKQGEMTILPESHKYNGSGFGINQPIHAIQEVLGTAQGGLKAGRNVIEFEIVDTPMTETGVIKISDAVVYYSTWDY
jgi:hypothetical protein